MLATVDVHFAAMGLLEQIVDVLGYDIDDFDLQRFFLRDRYAFPHRLNRPLGITAALLRDALGERGSEVFDLLAHHAFDFLAAASHRVGRTDIGSRGHCRNMRRHGDEHTC